MASKKDRETSDTLNERLLLACENANIGLARELFSQGADSKYINHAGESALHLAVKSGSADMTSCVLFDLGVEPNLRDAFGRTPLHWACQMGHQDICEALLLANADTTVKDDMGVEAKVYAEMAGFRDIVRMLNLVRRNQKKQ